MSDDALRCLATLFSEPSNNNTSDQQMSSTNTHDDKVEKEQEEEYITMRKRLFHEDTDAKFKFIDGKVIQFDKKLLCWCSKSPVFYQISFGPLSEDVIEIKDFDYSTFQLFLDCIMGFMNITRDNAAEIFPVACKYLVTECIEKCAISLKPVFMNADVCHLLNMAFFYDQPKLHEVVQEFVLNDGSPYGLLENEEFSYLLSIDSFLEIIKWVKMDSYVLIAIVRWCGNFLKNNNRLCSIKQFLHELGIDIHFNVNLFESGVLLYDFISSTLGRNIFSPTEVCKYFINPIYSAEKKSKWIKKCKGQFFTEEYEFSDLQLNRYNSISVKVNKIVMYNSPLVNLSCTVAKYSSPQPANLDHKNGDWNSSNQIFTFSLQEWYNNFRYHGSSRSHKFQIKYSFMEDCRIFVTNNKPKLTDGLTRQDNFMDKFYLTENIILPSYA